MATPTFTITEEQQQLRGMVRTLFAEHATSERVREVMLDSGVDEALWEAISSLGLLGLTIPEWAGGAGATFLELAIVAEEAGRRLVPVPLLSSGVLGTTVLTAAATDRQLREHAPGVAAGTTRLALVHLDEAGSATSQPGVRAARLDEGWVLDGVSGLVVGADDADLLITAATSDSGTELFLVPADESGVKRSSVPPLDLTRPLANIEYHRVRVDDNERLQGDGARAGLHAGLAAGAAALACEQVGAADQILATTVAYTKDRIQFGRPIGSFQAVKHRLADHLVRLEAARSVAWHAARVVADADPDELAIATPMAASLCSEMFEVIAADCLQLHGGIGFTWDHDAHLYLKRAKSSKLLLGDPVHHRRELADALGL